MGSYILFQILTICDMFYRINLEQTLSEIDRVIHWVRTLLYYLRLFDNTEMKSMTLKFIMEEIDQLILSINK